MSDTTFTFRVDEILKYQFTEAAKNNDRVGSQLLREFMRDFVKKNLTNKGTYDAWFRKQVEIGLEDAKAGRITPNKDIEAEFSARRTTTRNKIRGR